MIYIYIYILHVENNKTLLTEIKGDLNKGRDIPCTWMNEKIHYYQGISFSQLNLIDLTQSKSKSQQLFCDYQSTDSKIYMRR